MAWPIFLAHSSREVLKKIYPNTSVTPQRGPLMPFHSRIHFARSACPAADLQRRHSRPPPSAMTMPDEGPLLLLLTLLLTLALYTQRPDSSVVHSSIHISIVSTLPPPPAEVTQIYVALIFPQISIHPPRNFFQSVCAPLSIVNHPFARARTDKLLCEKTFILIFSLKFGSSLVTPACSIAASSTFKTMFVSQAFYRIILSSS